MEVAAQQTQRLAETAEAVVVEAIRVAAEPLPEQARQAKETTAARVWNLAHHLPAVAVVVLAALAALRHRIPEACAVRDRQAVFPALP